MKKLTTFNSLHRRLLSYIKPFWPMLLLGLCASGVSSALDAGFTYLMRPLFDKSFLHLDIGFVKQIPWIILIGVSLRGLVGALGAYCMTWVARSVVKKVRQEVFAHLLRLPANYYDEITSGQLLSKMLYNVEQMAYVSADALSDFVQSACLAIGLLTVMMVISWRLGLIFLLTVPFVAILVHLNGKRVRRVSHRVQKNMGTVTDITAETIEGYKVVRLFGGESYEVNKFKEATELSRRNDMKVAASKSFNVFGVQLIIAIGIASIIAVATHFVSVIPITGGSFLAMIAAMLQLIKPLKTLTTIDSAIQGALAGAESIFVLLDEPVEDIRGKTLAHRAQGAIVFDNVSYAYRQGPLVLHDINLTIRTGEMVALVGHSGSGKTTLVSLLPRFYEPSQGQILLDGEAIHELSLPSVREQMAMVGQHVTLFNDTLANNIAYGRSDVTREQIIQAAKQAYADEFIRKLPDGYDTFVGENGVLLSGGQRQRLAIARAILKDAPILILDEATSALDSESEQYIQTALEKLIENRTTLVVAHRLSTIIRADKIIVLRKGRIVEQGHHLQLLALDGYYAQLYRTQQLSVVQDEVGA